MKTEPLPAPPGLPGEVRLVAWALIVLGGSALLDLFAGLPGGRLTFALDLLLLPAGAGLLNGRGAWRGRAVALLGIEAAATALVLLALFALPGPARSSGFWKIEGAPSTGVLLLNAALVVPQLAATLWSLHVLTRRDVRAFFGQEGG